VSAQLAHLNIAELRWEAGERAVGVNDIVQLTLLTQTPVLADTYDGFRATGSFILIDPVSNETIAAGMIQAS
jgi:sulfate adenylyltransferase subunit 1 (EFTu-like GTPase family)